MLREKLEGEQDKNRPARQLLKDVVEEKVAPQGLWEQRWKGSPTDSQQSLARFLYGLR